MSAGRVRRAWLGIAGARIPVAPELAARLGTATGLQIASVVRGSPAAEAGLRRGDIVVSVDGHHIVTATAIQKLMVEDAIARRIEMTVWRNGALVDVFVVPRELVETEPRRARRRPAGSRTGAGEKRLRYFGFQARCRRSRGRRRAPPRQDMAHRHPSAARRRQDPRRGRGPMCQRPSTSAAVRSGRCGAPARRSRGRRRRGRPPSRTCCWTGSTVDDPDGRDHAAPRCGRRAWGYTSSCASVTSPRSLVSRASDAASPPPALAPPIAMRSGSTAGRPASHVSAE